MNVIPVGLGTMIGGTRLSMAGAKNKEDPGGY